MQKQNLRQLVSQLFGLPAMNMPWSLYISTLNEAGKLTARSIMDIMVVLLTIVEEYEERLNSQDTRLAELTKPQAENISVELPQYTVPSPTPEVVSPVVPKKEVKTTPPSKSIKT